MNNNNIYIASAANVFAQICVSVYTTTLEHDNQPVHVHCGSSLDQFVYVLLAGLLWMAMTSRRLARACVSAWNASEFESWRQKRSFTQNLKFSELRRYSKNYAYMFLAAVQRCAVIVLWLCAKYGKIDCQSFGTDTLVMHAMSFLIGASEKKISAQNQHK